MPIPLGSVTVSASGVVTVYAGTPGTVGAVAIYNESPYAINASAGTGALPIMAQTVDILYTDTGGFSGNITLTTSDYLSNASDAPSFIVFLAVYQPGEPIRGTYPAPLMRLAAGGAIVTNTPANVFEQDLFTPFVLTGYVATKDGSVVNQLDVTAGVAFLRQASDNSLLRIANNATTFLTTVASTTYYLDLNPDGSWSWATSHSGVTNHLTIASVTTDGSGNISAVTDARTLTPTLLNESASGTLALPTVNAGATGSGLQFGPALGTGSYVQAWLRFITSPFDGVDLLTPLGGTLTTALRFITATGGVTQVPFAIGDVASATTGAKTEVAGDGHFTQINGQATAGSFGVAVIVAQAINTHVTATTQQTILTFTPGVTGLYRASLYIMLNNGTSGQTITASALYYDGQLNTSQGAYFTIAAGSLTILGNTNTVGNGSYPAFPLQFYAETGQAISITYQDRGGTPNDYVTAMIERLS